MASAILVVLHSMLAKLADFNEGAELGFCFDSAWNQGIVAGQKELRKDV